MRFKHFDVGRQIGPVASIADINMTFLIDLRSKSAGGVKRTRGQRLNAQHGL